MRITSPYDDAPPDWARQPTNTRTIVPAGLHAVQVVGPDRMTAEPPSITVNVNGPSLHWAARIILIVWAFWAIALTVAATIVGVVVALVYFQIVTLH